MMMRQQAIGSDEVPIALLYYSTHVLLSFTSLTRIPPEQGLLPITLLATLSLRLLLIAPAARARLQLPLQLLLDKFTIALGFLAQTLQLRSIGCCC